MIEALKTLDYKTLLAKTGIIGCPFFFTGGNDRHIPRNLIRAEKESYCKELCGKLFPKAYQPYRCPCWSGGINPTYVRERFWKKLNEAQPTGKETS